MKVLFTGTRKELNEAQREQIRFWLYTLVYPDGHVIVGDCPTGVDALVAEWCRNLDIECEVYKADWERYGKPAGPLRNKAMVANNPDITIGFPLGESRGTWNCISQAASKNLSTAVIPLDNIS